MTTNYCDACAHPLDQYWRDDHASAANCKECGQDICSDCAAFYESEGGYGDDGQGVHTKAICKECAERDREPDWDAINKQEWIEKRWPDSKKEDW